MMSDFDNYSKWVSLKFICTNRSLNFLVKVLNRLDFSISAACLSPLARHRKISHRSNLKGRLILFTLYTSRC